MKRQYLARIIAISTLITGSTGILGNYDAYSDTYYNNQGNVGVSGRWVSSNNGLWYFYDYCGTMKTGWLLNNGKWYFLDNTGVMQIGVIQVDDKVYIFNENGEMQVGSSIINGILYKCDNNGAIIGDSYPTVSKAFTKDGASAVSYYNGKVISDEDSTPDDPNEVRKDDSNTNKYTVEFRNEDGDTIKTKSVSEGEKLELYEPKKNGYEFDSWSTKEDGEGKTYDADDKITVKDDIVLYANWNDKDNNNHSDDDNTSKKFARSVSISSANNKNSITTKGGTIKLDAQVDPEDATDKSVTWSIVEGSENATLSSDGTLTAIKNGEVVIKAKADDGSGVYDKMTITITGQDHEENANNGNANVNSKSLSLIEVTGEPKLNYNENEKIDLTGLKVKLHYADGSESEEISYSNFNNYNISIKNYENGQELIKGYVSRNKKVIIACGNKTASTDNLNVRFTEGPSVAQNIKSFDKNNMEDVTFEYSDGTIEGTVKKIQLLKDNVLIPEDKYSVDYATKKITIKKEYISIFDTGDLNIFINMMDDKSTVILSKSCIINIKDTEIKEAPNNFIKLEKGTQDKYTKATILNTIAEESSSRAANYNTSDLEYNISLNDLSTKDLLVSWKDYNGPINAKVHVGDYINIRKKSGNNTQPSKVYSKNITEDYVASISSMNTIKSFKLRDANNKIYEGTINGNNITVLADNPDGTDKSVDISNLSPIVEYTGTSSEAAKVKLKIKGQDMARKNTSENSKVVEYTTETSYESSSEVPAVCEVFAESGASRTYNITVYEVKPQKVAVRPNKTVVENVTKSIEKVDSKGIPILDNEGHKIYENKIVPERKLIEYNKLYTDGGIDLYLTTDGIATVTVRDPLSEGHFASLDNIVKYTDLGENNPSGNVNVGLIFNDIDESAQSVKVSTSLAGLLRTESSVNLEDDSVYALNKKYLKYVEVAARRSTDTGASSWEYIYKGQAENSKTYYYEWLDSSNKIIGYSKLKINVKAK